MSCASLVPTRVRVGARASKAAVTRRVAVASARKEEAPKARRGILRGAGVASVMASSSPALAAAVTPQWLAVTPPIVGELARSDLWFGWYFAPGGVVLGPALILTVFLVGGAIFEKVTGKAVSNKPFKKKD